MSLETEVERRRTFAIISHPDAGKTTLTEKLLLYGGAIVNRRSSRGAPARARGDLGLDGAGARTRHLDHVDGPAVPLSRLGRSISSIRPATKISARTRTARCWPPISAVMLIDAAKGVEPQTRKLFAICRARAHPALHVHQQDGPPERAIRSSCSTSSRTCSASAPTR